MRATVLEFAERYPWAVGVVAVPLTVLGLGGVAIYPFVFVPLLLLASAALIVVEVCAAQQEEAEHRAEVAARPHVGSDLAQMNSDERLRAEAAEARDRAARLWAQAEDAEARARAAEARVRAIQPRSEAEADTEQFPRVDYP